MKSASGRTASHAATRRTLITVALLITGHAIRLKPAGEAEV